MGYTILKKTVLRREMKKFLPENSRLETKAINQMNRILNEVFQSIMNSLKEEPYQDFSEYLVYKHGQKFLQANNNFLHEFKSINSKMNFLVSEMEEKQKEIVATE